MTTETTGVWKTGILPDDGQPIEVLMLPLYALEDIGPDIPPNFVYQVMGGDGQTYEIIYPLDERLKNPPSQPNPDDDRWAWIEWERFQAALNHRTQTVETSRQKALNCARHILAECIRAEDRGRIISPAGYDCVYQLALCPEVKGGDIERELRSFFPGLLERDGDHGSP